MISIHDITGAMLQQSAEYPDPGRKVQVLGSSGEITLSMIKAHGASKIRNGYNDNQVPIQIILLGGTIAGKPSPPWPIKIVIAWLRTILRDER